MQDLLAESDSPFGRLRHVVPAGRLSETPPFWAHTSVRLGAHEPAWPPNRRLITCRVIARWTAPA
jgi:hypothetical protein